MLTVSQNNQEDRRQGRLLRHNEVLRDLTVLHMVYEIKWAMRETDDFYARQLWSELSHDEQMALWVAPKYGGIFTTEERKVLKGG